MDVQAQGRVKRNKLFPVFLENGKRRVFKPLFKTKLFQRHNLLIAKYFDPKTPIYKLTICNNIQDEMKSKYSCGTIVDSIDMPERKIMNLFEVFRNYPDPMVNIKEHFNICEIFYDYSSILESKLMKENEQLARGLAM